VKWKGSTTLKAATAQANGVGFFEYLQQIENFWKEQNIPPANYERRTTALLLGIEEPQLRAMVMPHVHDIENYAADDMSIFLVGFSLVSDFPWSLPEAATTKMHEKKRKQFF